MFVASTTNREDIKMLVIPTQPMTPYFEKVQ